MFLISPIQLDFLHAHTPKRQTYAITDGLPKSNVPKPASMAGHSQMFLYWYTKHYSYLDECFVHSVPSVPCPVPGIEHRRCLGLLRHCKINLYTDDKYNKIKMLPVPISAWWTTATTKSQNHTTVSIIFISHSLLLGWEIGWSRLGSAGWFSPWVFLLEPSERSNGYAGQILMAIAEA